MRIRSSICNIPGWGVSLSFVASGKLFSGSEIQIHGSMGLESVLNRDIIFSEVVHVQLFGLF
jgi:hypothetical protein